LEILPLLPLLTKFFSLLTNGQTAVACMALGRIDEQIVKKKKKSCETAVA